MRCDGCGNEGRFGEGRFWIAGEKISETREWSAVRWDWKALGDVREWKVTTTLGDFFRVDAFLCESCLRSQAGARRQGEGRLARSAALYGFGALVLAGVLALMPAEAASTFAGIVGIFGLVLVGRSAVLLRRARTDAGPEPDEETIRGLLYPFAWSKANDGLPYVDPLLASPPENAAVLWRPDEFERLAKAGGEP